MFETSACLPSFVKLPLVSGTTPLRDAGLLRDKKAGEDDNVPEPGELPGGVMALPNNIDNDIRVLFCGRMTEESHTQLQQVLRYKYVKIDDDPDNEAVTFKNDGQEFKIAKRNPPIVPDRDHARIVTPPYNIKMLSVEDAASITQFNDLLDAGGTMNVKDFEYWMKDTCNQLIEIMNSIYDFLIKNTSSAQTGDGFSVLLDGNEPQKNEMAAHRVLFALHQLLGPAKLTINTFPFTKLLTQTARDQIIEKHWTKQLNKLRGADTIVAMQGPLTAYGFAPNTKGLMGKVSTGYGLDATHIRKLGCWDNTSYVAEFAKKEAANTPTDYHLNAVFEAGDQRFSQERGGTRYDMSYTDELGERVEMQQLSPSQALATFVATNVRKFCVNLLSKTLDASLEAKKEASNVAEGSIDPAEWSRAEMSVQTANKIVEGTLAELMIPEDKIILEFFFPTTTNEQGALVVGGPISQQNSNQANVWLVDTAGKFNQAEWKKSQPLLKKGQTRGVNWKDQGVLADKDILHLFGLPRPHRRDETGQLVPSSEDEQERKALADSTLGELTVMVDGGKYEPLQRVLQFLSKLFVAPHAIDGATSDLSNIVAVVTNYTIPFTYKETMDRSLAWKAAVDPNPELKRQYDGMLEIMKIAQDNIAKDNGSRTAFISELNRNTNLKRAFDELWAPTIIMQDGEQDDALAVKFSALILYLKNPRSLATNFYITFQLPSNVAIARKTEEKEQEKAQDWLLTRTRLMWAMRAGVMHPLLKGRSTPLVRCFLDDQAENLDKIYQNSMWMASMKAGAF